MQWIEPIDTARGRAKLRNRTWLVVCGTLFAAVALAFIFAVLIHIMIGIWHWSRAFIGGLLGALIGLALSLSNRFPVLQQEIELRTYDFRICGTKEVTMRFNQLRGYSIITPTVAGTTHRLLMLYQDHDSGCFSIGIAPGVTD